MTTLKRGETYTVLIDALSDRGFGMASGFSKPLFVPNVLPGDTVTCLVTQRKYGGYISKLINIKKYSPQRGKSICTHYPNCGGCRFIDLTYPQQLAHKETLIQECMANFNCTINPIIPCDSPYFYRNKMEFSFGKVNDKICIGLKKGATFDTVIPVTTCYLQSELSNDILNFATQFFNTTDLSVWNHHTHTGILRYLTIRESKQNKTAVVTLVTSEEIPEIMTRFTAQLRAQFPHVTGVVQALQQEVSDTSFTQNLTVISGSELLRENLGHVTFEISPLSFFQSNPVQAVRLYQVVADFAALTGKESVLDLYCGTGSIGLFLAKDAGEIIGIEEIEAAIEDAKHNATLNNITNTTFFAGRVKNILKFNEFKPDLVVVDPPRSGMVPKALKRLIELNSPRIIYVSCNPASMAENLIDLIQAGYTIDAVQPVDMFPNTLHVECVVSLSSALDKHDHSGVK